MIVIDQCHLLWKFWGVIKDLVTDVYRFNMLLCFEIVESEPESKLRIAVVPQLPSSQILVSGIFVCMLFFHDQADVFPSLHNHIYEYHGREEEEEKEKKRRRK